MAGHLIGRLLRGVHAGVGKIASNQPNLAAGAGKISLSCPSFGPDHAIPMRCAGKGVGENVSPALLWDGAPAETKELVLVVEDPDAPLPRPFVHVIATGLPPDLREIPEGALSGSARIAGVDLGLNSFGKQNYAGPRAIPGHGPHRYAFQLFALDRRLQFARPPKLRDLLAAMTGAVIASGRIDGLFERT